MMDYITKAWNWIKANYLIAGGILIVVIFLFFRRSVMRLFRGRTVRRRRNRTLPRSVGTRRRKNKAPVKRSANGKVKKPWQVKGSEAARRHMAKIRRMR
jgi:hypothetical protein